MDMNYDFAGWATRNDMKCSDGRTIKKDAFKHQDGLVVPLVWNHQHDSSQNVLGQALLHNREDGVYAYCYFNDTDSGQNAKKLVDHGDVKHLSICANKLKQKAGDVLHGMIREVSLVLSGANPGAYIETVVNHGDDSDEMAIMSFVSDDTEILIHSFEDENSDENDEDEDENNSQEKDKKSKKENDKKSEEDDESKDKKTEDEDKSDDSDDSNDISHADNLNKEGNKMADNERTVQDVYNEMSDEQKDVVAFLVGQAVQDATGENMEGEDKKMNHNVFENDLENNDEILTHADMVQIFDNDWKRFGSLKEAVKERIGDGELMHADNDTPAYGIEHIDYLFPEAQTINNEPGFIKRNMDWVGRVMSGVHHTPFSRIKSIYANITADEARAKGYIKGNLKKEEVITLLKRVTTPQTVYKKQKLDKDDIHDITDFDVVAWLKREMRMMLDEELGRAYLIGDGRLADDEDKISEEHIRPIWKDEELYTINKVVELSVSDINNKDKIANAIIDAVIEGQETYEGSGNPLMFCEKSFLTYAMLMRNSIGERVYKSKSELASEMEVGDIIPVPVFKNQTREVNGVTRSLKAVIVNLNDYNVGADKGGSVDMFEDFDIDRNQNKYLIETRCSGALIKPYSAIVVELVFQ